ncbi:MAG: FAD:protein FMN transferase [Ruminococcaceae bacterium]|nr:FAD:protein FMN transferase [Oscillospiraceae bacterium]
MIFGLSLPRSNDSAFLYGVNMKARIISVFLATVLLFLTLFGCGAEAEPRSKTYFEYFDTASAIYSYAEESEESFIGNCEAVAALFSDYHKLFDIYYEYSGVNNLCTVNKNAGVAPVSVDIRLIDFLEYAVGICKECGLETNIAMGSVLSLWHEARENADGGEAHLPSEAELRAAGEHVSLDAIVIDRGAGTVYISDAEVSIDVGALGKGYAVMKATELLKERGADRYVLNVGGNISAIGEKANGKGWVTGITNPDGGDFSARIELKDGYCVTSGDYERYFEVDGVRYHHIIDKDTLMPAKHFRSVSVISDDGALADALSTALFCMPYEEGVKLLQRFDGVDAFWIFSDGQRRMTEGFEKITLK